LKEKCIGKKNTKMSDSVKYTVIDGKAVPVLPAKAVSQIKHKRSGKIYNTKEDFHAEVNNPEIDTNEDDLQEDLQITVASLDVFSKTK
tara:strand:- start:428 stop:691 length:264 start_codon:yes stop_codon:yes gene_type:complete